MGMTSFMALFDAHVGFDSVKGRLQPLHDQKMLDSVLSFASDFKPDRIVLGGDMLDCGPISHHRRGKVGELEGLRLRDDALILSEFIRELEGVAGKGPHIYHSGNHEAWLDQLTDELPGLEGLLSPPTLLDLSPNWKFYEQGEVSKLGKLYFLHGDQVNSTANPAKWAVETFEKNVRFGHFHTYAAHTKIGAVDAVGHTGISVPCLCHRNPRYGKGSPNRWVQGFLYGWVDIKSGEFTDSVVTAVNSHFIVDGKKYRG